MRGRVGGMHRPGPGLPAAWAICLGLLAGCSHVPPARFAPGDRGPTGCRCAFTLTRQLVADTVTAAACHPGQTALQAFVEPPEHLLQVTRGAIGKRLVKPAPPLCQAACATPAGGSVCPAACPGPAEKPAHIQLYPDGCAALMALEQLLARATCRIDVLMFQWNSDPLGAELAARLAARAGPQLRVRVLVDGGGNLIFGPCQENDPDVNRVVRTLAQTPYVEVIRIRNPLGRFDHRKLVVVDGRIAWTGGRNFTRRSFFDQHDLSLTVEGPLADDLQACFERYWRAQGGRPAEASQRPATLPEGLLPVNAWARLVCTEPLDGQIERAVYDAVDGARHHVYMENFTFCDGRLVHKLALARQRGVDVRVVMTLSECCTGVICRANRVTANRLLRAGVRVYVYPAMTHTKAAAVDGCWAYAGTGNFDPLSLRRNRELGLVLSACPIVQEVEQRLFLGDLRPEWELKQPLPAGAGDYFCEFLSSICL